ncbi:WYL domain-containing protein [Sphingomonas sp. CFBP 13603]|uniref:WYL domain-containing protein n=1 Tax=Sphingomonas sp. CFBP 13603 TaxID=2774040 RepID=UPI0018668A97|nr:WYL domain-containing protein [Sphingomonas sp. CFBP 13603]MBE2993767.1 WYL domain-containing protein [Sphingomonas sp. CFBP 13603]
MTGEGGTLKWGVERRLEFIEFRLFWEGGVNRSDIVNTFDVSVPQASKDLTLYQERAPHNALYDKSARRYVAGPGFKPIFLKLNPYDYLSRLRSVAEGLIELGESWITQVPDIDIALTPRLDVNGEVLRTILGAVRDVRSVDIHYQSMSKDQPNPTWRHITPHAFGYDGFRWHVRGYCHITDKFKDFPLSRILDVGEFGEAGAPASRDALWQERCAIEVGPHPGLTESQKAVVAKDFGMAGGSAVLTVRYAMVFCVLKRLGLLADAAQLPARSQDIVVVNRDEMVAALEKAELAQ